MNMLTRNTTSNNAGRMRRSITPPRFIPAIVFPLSAKNESARQIMAAMINICIYLHNFFQSRTRRGREKPLKNNQVKQISYQHYPYRNDCEKDHKQSGLHDAL